MSYTENIFNFEIALNNLIEQSGLQVDLLYYIFKSKTNQLKAICFQKDKNLIQEELLSLQNQNSSQQDQIK